MTLCSFSITSNEVIIVKLWSRSSLSSSRSRSSFFSISGTVAAGAVWVTVSLFFSDPALKCNRDLSEWDAAPHQPSSLDSSKQQRCEVHPKSRLTIILIYKLHLCLCVCVCLYICVTNRYKMLHMDTIHKLLIIQPYKIQSLQTWRCDYYFWLMSKVRVKKRWAQVAQKF